MIDDRLRGRIVGLVDHHAHHVPGRQFAYAALQKFAINAPVQFLLVQQVEDHMGFEAVGGPVEQLHAAPEKGGRRLL